MGDSKYCVRKNKASMRLLIYSALSLIGVTHVKILGYPVSDWLFILLVAAFILVHLLLPGKRMMHKPLYSQYLLIFVSIVYVGGIISSINSLQSYKSIINVHRFVLIFFLLPLIFYNLISSISSLTNFE